MDNSLRDGGGARTCSRYATLSTPTGHISGQCTAHSVGLSHVRNNGNVAIFDLVQRSDCSQASTSSAAPFLCIGWNRVFAAMRYHVDYIVECAGHTFAMQTRRLPSGRHQVSHAACSESCTGDHISYSWNSNCSLTIGEAVALRVSRAYTIWSGLGMSIQGVRTCGDYMFSGHTVALTILNFFITECKWTTIFWIILQNEFMSWTCVL